QRRQTIGGQQRQQSLTPAPSRSNPTAPRIAGRGQPRAPSLMQQPRPLMPAGRGYPGNASSSAHPPTIAPRNYAPQNPYAPPPLAIGGRSHYASQYAPPPRTPSGYNHMPPPPRQTASMSGATSQDFPTPPRPLNLLL